MTQERQQTDLATKSATLPAMQVGERGIQLSSFEDLQRFANMVLASGFAPNGMDSVAKISIAIEYGLELGVSPMQALQGMYVINGRPSVYGDLFLALCQSDPRWDDTAFNEWDEGVPYELNYTWHCRMAKRGGAPQVETFSVADAMHAGLWQKNDVWKKYPKRMLRFRARTYCGRMVFPERLRGLTTVEEAQDIIDVEVNDARPAPISMPRRIVQEAPPLAQGASAPPDTQAPQHEAPSTPDADGASVAPPTDDLIAQIGQAIKAKGYDVLGGVLKNFELKAPVKAKDLAGWSEEELRNLLREVNEAQ